MNKIQVNVGKGYEVNIGAGLLSESGAMTAGLMPACKAAVIAGSNVAKLYLETVIASFRAAGFDVVSLIYKAGEESKNISTLSDILEFLAQSELTRRDLVVALGGGVTGDMAGFAAGVFLRGIRFVQLPTTFLAAVDSSVGGKTGIDLQAGKNLAGVFLQPEAVICDTSTFSTLPPEVFACGTAEAVKTGILSGRELFSIFSSQNIHEKLDDIISLCVRYKAAIVEQDEFEVGPRKLLNLGHTVAHAIEKLSGFAVPHGMAVAAGIAVITRAACAMELCSLSCRDDIIAALHSQKLPTETQYSAEELSRAALSDKKRSGNEISLVIPQEIGHCIIKNYPVSELCSIIKMGLE